MAKKSTLLSDPRLSTQSTKKKICLAVPDFVGPIRNGGVGTAYTALAELLAQAGNEVWVFYCSPHSDSEPEFAEWQRYYLKRGIQLLTLTDSSIEYELLGPSRTSYTLYQTLKAFEFDIIHFPDFRGLGYFPILAKKLGIAFQKTELVVIFNGPHEWVNFYNHALPSSLSEVQEIFLERKSIQWADTVVFPTHAAEQWAKENGWEIEGKRLVEYYPKPITEIPKRWEGPRKNFTKIVFFGRLEDRKGISQFIQAVDGLSAKTLSKVEVVFLGRFGVIKGMDAKAYFKAHSRNWSFDFKVIDELNQIEAVKYLLSENSLVVMPSAAETLGNTVLECLMIGKPFLASDIPPFLELVPEEFHEQVLFKLDAESIREKIERAMTAGVPKIPPPTEVTSANERWGEWHARLQIQAKTNATHGGKTKLPKVTVCLTHKDRKKYLKEALLSLTQQTHLGFDIVIVDDGSQAPPTDAEIRTWLLDSGLEFTLLFNKESKGPNFSRNKAGSTAKGEFLLFMDDDNRAKPDELETFVNVAQRTGADILSCCFDRFSTKGPLSSRWIPVGEDLNLAPFLNVLGDTNSLIRKSVFTSVGGFTQTRDVGYEDFDLILRAILAGHRYFPVPEALFWYRNHEGSLSRKLDEYTTLDFRISNFTVGGHSLKPLLSLIHAYRFRHGISEFGYESLSPRTRTDIFRDRIAELGNTFIFEDVVGSFKLYNGSTLKKGRSTVVNATKDKVKYSLSRPSFDSEVVMMEMEYLSSCEMDLAYEYESKKFGKIRKKVTVARGVNRSMIRLYSPENPLNVVVYPKLKACCRNREVLDLVGARMSRRL